MIDLLIHSGTVITMDSKRRILAETSVAIHDGAIIEIGPATELRQKYPAASSIDATRKIVLPGMVDLHGDLGGSILKSMAEGLDSTQRRAMLDELLTSSIDEEFWQVEAQLGAIERLKFGTTCMFTMLGGNGTRSDDIAFGEIPAREYDRIGLRARIGVGPARPPWPRPFGYWRDGVKTVKHVDFDTVIDNCDRLLAQNGANPRSIVEFWVSLSRIGNRNEGQDPAWSPEHEKWVHRQAEAAVALMTKHDVGFWTHMYGNAIEFAHDEKLGLLGPRTILSHCTGISERSIAIMQETGTHAAHHPRAARMYSQPGHCPLPEMIDAGINVGLGADVPQNHDCDIFLDMKAACRAQRLRTRDPALLPPGKLLEMATIDGYRALGLDKIAGSVEVGKRADIITVDLDQPHLTPTDMPVHRLVYHATGRDVSDVIVDGRPVMTGRHILSIDEPALIHRAQICYRKVRERGKLQQYAMTTNPGWGVSRQ
jgi:cytosine/adenosine deaminase-related metal-dependent hydrolase